jgi:hypothetical protein
VNRFRDLWRDFFPVDPVEQADPAAKEDRR